MNSDLVASRKLILRLSSLGDVIMATAALEALPEKETADWVTSIEYAELLRSHPRIGRVWEFDRRSGLGGWVRLCRALHSQGYGEVLDLHRSLRSSIARLLFWIWGGTAQWKRVSKQRVRFLGYCSLKGLWPRAWRPEPWISRHALLAGGTGRERPNLRHLTRSVPGDALPACRRPFLCVMPGSRWNGKKWPVERFLDACRSLSADHDLVVLGARDDRESIELDARLSSAGIPHFSAVGRLDLSQTAALLERSAGYLGNDTGIAYLSESVGTRAVVVFGPTTPDLGFGPWGPRSAGIGADLWCRPCGKDGTSCFRLIRRYHCLTSLRAEVVVEAVRTGRGDG